MKLFKYILLLISLFSYLVPVNATWLSVDPLSDKYPHISPYAYCGNNPMKFVDPDGREKHIFLSDKESYAARNFGNISPNKTTIKLKMVINQLSDSIKKIFSQENE